MEKKLRHFGKHDWDGYAGCELSEDGRLPQIGSLSVFDWPANDGEDWLSKEELPIGTKASPLDIVVDAHSVGVYGIDYAYIRCVDEPYDVNVTIAEKLLSMPSASIRTLEKFGFEERCGYNVSKVLGRVPRLYPTR